MGAPLSFRRECVPVALAAVAGISLREAADRLWRVRTFWGGRGPAIGPGGSVGYGTPDHALGDVLLRMGWSVELWHGERGGRLVADRTIYPELLSRLAHDRARRHRLHRREDPTHGSENDAPGDAPRTAAEGPSNLRPLSDWTSRMAAGYWLYAVRPATDGPPAHLVAYWGATQLAGNLDGTYDDAPVAKALRALRPDEHESRQGEDHE